ncbi:hypothetical protein HY468_01470 [Candidatus Roizmanbacteria bacterium]|nr:hypothetical protein [Candidatus Roizmanbacteria bacterium]
MKKVLLLIILILLVEAGVYVWLTQRPTSPEMPVSQQPIKTNEYIQQVTPPASTSQTYRYDVFGTQKIKIGAVIDEIVKEGETYTVTTDDGETLTVLLTEKTLIGDAWEKKDENGGTRSSYDIITLSELGKLKKGDRVTISYTLAETNTVEVDEFILP